MSVVRIDKTKNYTVMGNFHLRDKTLSYKAKGLLSFMLSLPEDWDYSVNGLVAVSKENIKAIRSTLKELEEHKYLLRTRLQDSKGKFDYLYTIYEQSYTPKGDMDNGNTDKDTQINTNKQNTNNKDKIDKTINPLVKELIKRKFISENDLDIFNYSDLFDNLLNDYDYKNIIIAINYTIQRWFLNKGYDEGNNKIENKFAYYKRSLTNNIIKISEETDLEW